ncbi:hypothetical protein ACDN41_11985 [Priestia aryabhattai]|uniref:hypothetical protein n=1 Tax=Priestia aryabhattai TaxID=412384 RepID=UPI003531C298
MRKVYGIQAEMIEQDLVEIALLKMELSNGEDKTARKILKLIKDYNDLIQDAEKRKEKNGHITW